MHVLCFGEHEVSANTTPTTIGSLGDFVRRSDGGARSGSRALILSGPSKKKSKSGHSSIRRNLDQNLEGLSPPVKKENAPDSAAASTSAQSSAAARGSGGSSSTTSTRSKGKVQASKGQPAAAASSAKGGLVNGLSGGMLAALGAMPQLGGVSSRSGGGMSTKRTQAEDKSATGSAGSANKDGGGGGADGTSASKVPRDPSKLCKCKKSKCVRQYCVCFRAGLLCEGCDCADCLNDGKHEAERLAAIEHIKTSDPLAFVDKIRPEQENQMLVDDSKDAKKHHVRGCRYAYSVYL